MPAGGQMSVMKRERKRWEGELRWLAGGESGHPGEGRRHPGESHGGDQRRSTGRNAEAAWIVFIVFSASFSLFVFFNLQQFVPVLHSDQVRLRCGIRASSIDPSAVTPVSYTQVSRSWHGILDSCHWERKVTVPNAKFQPYHPHVALYA